MVKRAVGVLVGLCLSIGTINTTRTPMRELQLGVKFAF
jgi:hypothetical protein